MINLPTSPRALLTWPWIAVMLIGLGLLLIGVPEDLEGPTLFNLPDDFGGPIPIARGTMHGFTLANAFAVILLVAGGLLLVAGGWRHRAAVRSTVRKRPLAVKLLGAQLTLGLALIATSGASTVLYLWAPGLFLAGAALFGLALLVWETLTPELEGSPG